MKKNLQKNIIFFYTGLMLMLPSGAVMFCEELACIGGCAWGWKVIISGCG